MNKKLKQKWVAALRSGKYKQCKKQLRRDASVLDGTSNNVSSEGSYNPKTSSYCCLGVLCAITRTKYEKTSGLPPNSLSDDLEKKIPDGVVEVTSKLVRMNDDDGYSFNQIADWIEKNL